ncbi:MAG TPA: site-2 protease family protein, partial [Gemmatimonadaceae bacterium]|nr:site-2 protease family protein [Gemmatimonadaceae bacterium]
MKWSWRMGRVAGIDIHVHATFPLLFAWITVVMLRSGATASAIAGTLALILAVFALIVIHETAHALTARRYGITTHDITLLPIGGIAHLDHMPREPKQELLIAVAGPAVNVVFAIVLYGILALTGGLSELRDLATADSTQITTSKILAELFGINLSLTVFNLLPAFPLDGGRVMRALLAIKRKDYVSATVAAAKVGKAFALLFGVVGLFVLDNPMLVVIALFVWLSAASEANAAQTSAALADVPLSQLLITDMRTLSPSDRLSSAVKLTVHGFQQDFPVVADGRLVGM